MFDRREDTSDVHTAFIRVTVRPDHADRAARAMLDLVEPTLAEPGCLTYEFYRDLDDPALFHCFEHWDSRQALDDHGTTAHVRAFLDEFGPVIEKWESHHTVGLS